MNKKEAIKKIQYLADFMMHTDWKTFDPTGKDKINNAYNKGYCEGFLCAMDNFKKILDCFEKKYIKLPHPNAGEIVEKAG